jgi:hypothetical protein
VERSNSPHGVDVWKGKRQKNLLFHSGRNFDFRANPCVTQIMPHGARKMIDSATLEIIKNFDHLSDNQIVGPQVVQFLLGGAASRRHVRRELPIQRRWITALVSALPSAMFASCCVAKC